MGTVIDRASSLQTLFNIILFIVLLSISFADYKRNSNHRTIIVIGIIVFSVFSFWGPDYFHYKEIFNGYKLFSDTYHLEKVYVHILDKSPFYSIYRLIIWGAAFLFLRLASLRLNVQSNSFFFLFVALYLLRFSYARASLSICMMIYGYSLLIKPSKHFSASFILGLLFIIGSLFFHKSSLIIASAIPLSFIKVKKSTFFLSILVFPLIAYYTKNYLYDFIVVNDMISDESTLNAFMLYTEDTSGGHMGLAQTIYTYGEMIPIYLVLLLGIRVFSVESRSLSIASHRMYQFFFWAVFIATVFAFVTPVIHRRILFLAQAPMVLMLSMAHESFRNKKFFVYAIILGILVQFYLLLYALYLS